MITLIYYTLSIILSIRQEVSNIYFSHQSTFKMSIIVSFSRDTEM